MRWLRVLVLSVAVVGVATLAGAQAPSDAARPNVVLIVTDDVGYADFSSYGARDIRTPNIDSLARDGTKLTDFYASPLCTSTRAALMTGRYQQRYQLERALPSMPNAGGQGLAAIGRSLPQLLKNNGYATGLVGKWHLGYLPAFAPNAHGFDYFFGFKSGFTDYYQHTDADGADDLFENGAPVHVTGYMTDLITERAVRFVQQNAARPFFLEVTYNAAHWPFQVPDHPSVATGHGRFVQPADDTPSSREDYAKIVERADQGVGQILQALDSLRLAQNTLVIFTNDNGGEWLSSNAPLFHRKDTLWEGGIRVPAIFRWPGHVRAGQVSSQVGSIMDLTASILGATMTTVPGDTKLEGMDLLPILSGRSPNVERTLFFRIAVAARQQRAVRQGEWKLLVDGDDTMLFNLARDIGERHDVAKERPDVARRLRPLLAQWEADVDAEAQARKNGSARP
jgi:arylsulfatase A-like enzyme